MIKNPPANAGDVDSIPGSGRPPGAGKGNPLQYSCLGNPTDQRSLAGCSPWGQRVRHNGPAEHKPVCVCVFTSWSGVCVYSHHGVVFVCIHVMEWCLYVFMSWSGIYVYSHHGVGYVYSHHGVVYIYVFTSWSGVYVYSCHGVVCMCSHVMEWCVCVFTSWSGVCVYSHHRVVCVCSCHGVVCVYPHHGVVCVCSRHGVVCIYTAICSLGFSQAFGRAVSPSARPGPQPPLTPVRGLGDSSLPRL